MNDGTILSAVPTLLANIASRLHDCLELQHFELWPHALSLIARLLRLWPTTELASAEVVVTDAEELHRLLIRVVRLRDTLVDGPDTLASLIRLSAGNSQVASLSLSPQILGDKILDELDRVCLVALETLGPELLLCGGVFDLEPMVKEL